MRQRAWPVLLAVALLSGGCNALEDDSPTQDVAADLVLDPEDLAQSYLGLGAQIWTGDTAWIEPLESLDARWVRVSMSPSFDQTPERAPTATSQDEMDAYMARNYSAVFETQLAHAISTWKRLQSRDVQMILHMWEAPSYWETGGALQTKHIPDYARLWGALLHYLGESGIQPTWIELSNEPDGGWNTQIRPEDYSALVKHVRQELDSRGLQTVGILGPGLSTLNHRGCAARWIGTLDAEVVSALGGWSVHTWDDFAERGQGKVFLESRWASFVEAVEARDPERHKPVFVTELGSKDTEFNGVRFTSPDNGSCGNAADSDAYAVRILEQAFTSLNHGAAALLIWQAADQSWECSNWGLVTSAAEDAEPRPAFFALKSFFDHVPGQARVIRTTSDDPQLNIVALHTGDCVVVGMANGSAEPVTRTLAFSGSVALDLTLSVSFSSTGIEEERPGTSVPAGTAIEVTLPAESVKTLVFSTRSGR